MESHLDNTSPKVSERKKIVRKKLYVFLFCFIVSSFIWLFIKLSEEYSEVKAVHVTFINTPSGKVFVNGNDSLITLQMKSKGFKLLMNSFFNDAEKIVIDVSSFLHKKSKSGSDYFILSSELIRNIEKQIHQQNCIASIEPDTLFFFLYEKYSKKVPVKAMLSMTFAHQYGLSDSILVVPDSVLVSGTKEIIDSINCMPTHVKTLTNINEKQIVDLNFDAGTGGGITVTPAYVKVIVPVEKYTESTIEVPIDIFGNEKVKIFPEKVEIKFSVPLSQYNNVDAGMFSVMVDIAKAKASNLKKVKLEISKKPSYVRINKMEPEKVEYILLK